MTSQPLGLAALVARHRTGRGQRVDTSLLPAATVLRPPAPRTADADDADAAAVPAAAVPAAAATVEPCTDLAALAADQRFAAALEHGGCALPRTPWEFCR